MRSTTGAELRQLLSQMKKGRHVYLQLSYNGRIWLQQWRKAEAYQLCTELSRVEARRAQVHSTDRDEYTVYVEATTTGLYIATLLS